MTSSFIAYLLWLPPFGWFGLHHLYMGRRLQAILWATTFGGYFVGWVRDLLYIPSYCRLERMRSTGDTDQLKELMRQTPTPQHTWVHFIAQILFSRGWLYAREFQFTDTYIPTLLGIVSMQAVSVIFAACSIWAVGSEGRRACSLKTVILWALGGMVMDMLLGELFLMSTDLCLYAGIYASYKTARWRTDRHERAIDGRLAMVLFVSCIMYTFVSIQLSDVSGNFHNDGNGSEHYEFSFGQAFRHIKDEGWNANWGEFFSEGSRQYMQGFTGGMSRSQAMDILQIDSSPWRGRGELTREMVQKAYRKMSLRYHPDKHAGDTAMLEEAQRMQPKINEAKEVLLRSFAKKART